jgi:hypothetical protein
VSLGPLLSLLACPSPEPDMALLDPETCRGCHAEHVEQWEGSMHAYAGQDPVFRAMNARGQREADLGDFCVRCHAPVALALGLTEDGTNLDEVPDHLQGVTCAACHGIESVQEHNNAGFTLALDGVFRGALDGPVDNDVHESIYSPLQDRNDSSSSELCGSCHDVVTPLDVDLERTYAQWSETIFNSETVSRQSCGHCHMRGRDGQTTTTLETPERRLHDHSMAAVDVALTDFPHREEQIALVEAELESTLLATLCVIPTTGGAEVTLELDNVTAGHHFPSGASHDRRVWGRLDVRLEGADLLDAPWEFALHDQGLDAEGEEALLFWEVADIEERGLPGVNTVGLPHTRTWSQLVLGDVPDTVAFTLTVTPVAEELLEELEASGDLDRSQLLDMPTFTPIELTWAGQLGSCVTSG